MYNVKVLHDHERITPEPLGHVDGDHRVTDVLSVDLRDQCGSHQSLGHALNKFKATD